MAKYCYYRAAGGMIFRYESRIMRRPGVTAFMTHDKEWLPPSVGAKLYASQYASELHEQIDPSSIIYAIRRSTSRSRETRAYDIYIIKGGIPIRINHAISAVTGIPMNKKGYLSVRGCGFSGENHIAERLFNTLWPHNSGRLTVAVHTL